MVKAQKKVGTETVTHEFADNQWRNLPKDKDGWEEVAPDVPKSVADALPTKK